MNASTLNDCSKTTALNSRRYCWITRKINEDKWYFYQGVNVLQVTEITYVWMILKGDFVNFCGNYKTKLFSAIGHVSFIKGLAGSIQKKYGGLRLKCSCCMQHKRGSFDWNPMGYLLCLKGIFIMDQHEDNKSVMSIKIF